jgi:hypothetical protein
MVGKGKMTVYQFATEIYFKRGLLRIHQGNERVEKEISKPGLFPGSGY